MHYWILFLQIMAGIGIVEVLGFIIGYFIVSYSINSLYFISIGIVLGLILHVAWIIDNKRNNRTNYE